MTFGARLAAAMDEHGPLCVGIDPHPGLLADWGLADDAAGLREFGLRVVEAAGPLTAALKPQSAFFERHGSAGIAALEDVLAACREKGILTILDVKRGDIDSTMAAYADAYLADASPLAADAITVSPFLGAGSLAPALDLSRRSGRGLFALCLTSNPQGADVQHSRDSEGTSVAGRVARWVAEANEDAEGLGSVGLVVGATIGPGARRAGVDLDVGGPILAPGVGAQGAGPRELAEVFGPVRSRVLASTSRGVLRAGPDRRSLEAATRQAAGDAARALRGRSDMSQ